MLGLADKIAIIERGIDGTSVYLIRISYLENSVLDLCSRLFIFYSPPVLFIICNVSYW